MRAYLNTEGVLVKRCSKCRDEKPATFENFNRQPSRLDGLRDACRDCLNKLSAKRQQAYRSTHKKKEAERQRRKYWENPEYREHMKKIALEAYYRRTGGPSSRRRPDDIVDDETPSRKET